MRIKEIEAEIKNLDLKDRATLAKWIAESLDNLYEAEVTFPPFFNSGNSPA
jgi:hypothetical protein